MDYSGPPMQEGAFAGFSKNVICLIEVPELKGSIGHFYKLSLRYSKILQKKIKHFW